MKNRYFIIFKNYIPAMMCILLLTSCIDFTGLHTITGSGNVTVEKRNIEEEFTGVKVSNGIELIIEQNDKCEVIVEADDNLQETIKTKVRNGTLIINCEYDSFIDVDSKKVIVKMPTIETLQASSGSSISNTKKLKTNIVTIVSSSAANIDLKINAEKIICKASSASNIYLNGLALLLETTASSASDIDAKDLLANEVIAKSSSGSSIDVHPILDLNATASSGSSINYFKTPKKFVKKESSGASIERN